MSGQEGARGPLAVGYVHDGRSWAAGRLTADQAEWMVARLQERGCTGFVIRDGLEYAQALLPPDTRVIAPRKHWGSQVGTVLDGYEVSQSGEYALVRFDDGPEMTWWIRGLDAVAGQAGAGAGASLPVVTVEQRQPGGAWAVRRHDSFLSADSTWDRPPPGQAGDSTWHEAHGFPLREALVLAGRHAPAFRTATTAPKDSPFYPFEEGLDFADYVILAGRHTPMKPASPVRPGRPDYRSNSAAAPGSVEGPLRQPASKASGRPHGPAGGQDPHRAQRPSQPWPESFHETALTGEVTSTTRGPAIAGTVGSTVGVPDEVKPGSAENGSQPQAGAKPASLDDLGLTYPAWQGDTGAAHMTSPASQRDETGHADLQPAAELEPGRTADRYVVARINKTYRTLGERPGPQHVGRVFVPYDDRHLSKEAAEESASVSNDRYRPGLHGKTFVAVRAEPIPGTRKFRNLDHPSLTSKTTPSAVPARQPRTRRTTDSAVAPARRARPGGPR